MAKKPVSLATQERCAGLALRAIFTEVHSSVTDDLDTAAAITCALPILYRYSSKLEQSWQWLERAEDDWSRRTLGILGESLARSRGWLFDDKSAVEQSIAAIHQAFVLDGNVMLWHLYELLLKYISDRDRRSLGTFYTPPQLARYLVHQADCRLREELGIVHGLFDHDLPGRILEPACGSGVFLAAALKCCRAHPDWNQLNAARIVPRLMGIDLSRVALFLCRLRLAVLLRSSGIELDATFPQPTLWHGNALAGPDHVPPLREPVSVVLGNPPFSYLSQNDEPWIQTLIRGNAGHAGFFSIDEQELAEKKTWLHDDYVKFLRLAQWCIDQNGHGVVSLVTNHGWLDNATFRIARQQLLRTFSRIDVVDLHGNAKKHEPNHTSERDENVFGIAQGIALATFTKTSSDTSPLLSRADLWGSRKRKLLELEQLAQGEVSLLCEKVVPVAPWFTFTKHKSDVPAEYQAAPLLTELMPVNSTVPVTARDHFVVARTQEELKERLAEFCDPKISDDEIRKKYFQRTRSNRYEPGDTRGWKLPAVRRTLMSEADPASSIRRCLYRPFVWRYVLWHPALIDWPRTEFTRHFDGGNLALLARRQSIAGREANFFWITDCLPLDGVIRSDNRGSESFLPLWVNGDEGRQANFAPELSHDYDPAELLAYCYALFHSPMYRTRYAAGLAMEFPRVLLPRERTLLATLAKLGRQLSELHLANPHEVKSSNLQSEICNLQSAIEGFHVGTYNVCRKWLQMEDATRVSPAFERLLELIARTIELQRSIDEAIGNAGDFADAFRS